VSQHSATMSLRKHLRSKAEGLHQTQCGSYSELVQRERVIEGRGFTVHVAALDDIIAAKEYANRSKDREALPELRAIRDAQER
jgi:hypothetical protein